MPTTYGQRMTIARPAVALAAITVLLTSCSGEASDDSTEGADPTGKPEQTRVVATAADGTSVEFEDFTVTCRP